jgi:hypothetical protein
MDNWLLFIYKVPNEPSARRVYVWRKLKAMGAILLHDSAWVLPLNTRTREKLQWLAGEVKDMEGGEAMLWEAKQVFTGHDADLVQQFVNQADALYKDILDGLQKKDPDLAALSRQYQLANAQDYFQSELGKKVYETLLELRNKGDS